MIKCEAGGEGENGMKGVGTVIMNRVRVPFGEYHRVCGGNLRCVLEQTNQFSCSLLSIGGQPNPRNVWAAVPEPIHYRIADWALTGQRLLGVDQSLWYYNPFPYLLLN